MHTTHAFVSSLSVPENRYLVVITAWNMLYFVRLPGLGIGSNICNHRYDSLRLFEVFRFHCDTQRLTYCTRRTRRVARTRNTVVASRRESQRVVVSRSGDEWDPF